MPEPYTHKTLAFLIGNEFGPQSRLVFPHTSDGLNAARVHIANSGQGGNWHVYLHEVAINWNEGEWVAP